jgi:hypothetical protein
MESIVRVCGMCGIGEFKTPKLVNHSFPDGTKALLCTECLRGFVKLNPGFKSLNMSEARVGKRKA